MKRIVVVAILIFLGAGLWRIGESLSSDAIGMALGVAFGVLAGLPVALLTLAAGRRRTEYEAEFSGRRPDSAYPYYPPQPPVIVVTGGPQLPGAQSSSGYLPTMQGDGGEVWAGQRANRVFTVVGEKEGLVEEW
jgi:hypothetical protein